MRFETSDKRCQAVKQSDFRMTAGGAVYTFLIVGSLVLGRFLDFASLEMMRRREV